METGRFGDPDVRIGPLRVWVHGRSHPDAHDYWDGNWLNATAECKGAQSRVVAHGSIIHLLEIVRFLKSLEDLSTDLKGSAVLDCMEPYLKVEIKAKSLGHLQIIVDITADHLNESHRFKGETDQTYLPPMLDACRAVLAKYPVRDPR